MNTLMKIIGIILIVIISAIVFSLTGLAIALILGIAIAIIVFLLIFSLIKTVIRLVLILGVILAVVLLLMKYSPNETIDKLSCQQDSDCVCGGIDTKTGDCFVGNKNYYDKFVNKEAVCPDFCTGIAGNGQTKCINNKCQNLFNQTR